MAFDFPANPVQGDIFIDTVTGAQYAWNSFAWARKYTIPPAGTIGPPAEDIPVDPPVNNQDTVQGALMSLNTEIETVSSDAGQKVAKAGGAEGIMTGFLTLSADPTDLLHAATKQYVDAIGAGLPLGGVEGEALVIDATGVPAWGHPIDSSTYTTAGGLSISQQGSIDFKKNELPRWSMHFGDRDDDADFRIQRFNDGGGSMGAAIAVSRKTGVADFAAVPTRAGAPLALKSDVDALLIRITKLEGKK